MKIIYNKFIPFKGFLAMNIFGILFVRGTEQNINDVVLNHERIHTAQMKELWYLPFYIIYLLEWVVRLFMRGNAYRNLSFEREAYGNEKNLGYLATRRRWAMWRKCKLIICVDLASGEDKNVKIVYKEGEVVDMREEKTGIE